MAETVQETLGGLRQSFISGKTRSVAWRKTQLSALLQLLKDQEQNVFDALFQDLGKHPIEAYRDEVGVVVKSINYTSRNLKKWVAPKNKGYVPLLMFPSRAELQPEPLGVVLIFASWNFPISLALDPVVGAIAAGNTVVLKPSEQAPACSSLLAKIIPQYMDASAVRVIQGGEEVSKQLLQQKWDKIFFTGSPQVGRIVMSAAAKHLTPVALELGGKCPVILDTLSNPSDLKVAIKRIVSGKWGPCSGQACIGIDYMLVEERLASTVIELLKKTMKRFYGESPKDSKCMSRVVNKHHFQRLQNLLKDPLIADSIVHGGSMDQENLFIEPIILLDPPLNAAVMTEEIFGPVLPIITLKNIDESVEFINSRPKPLTIYAFTKDEKFKKQIISETSSGSVTFNDVMIQFLCDGLPFGGVGESGFGRYHGKYSFDTFSHEKAIMRGGFFPEFEPRYPPWNDFKMKFIRLGYDLDYIGLFLLLVKVGKPGDVHPRHTNLIKLMTVLVQGAVSDLRQTFNSGKTQSVAWRKTQLTALLQLLKDQEQKIFDALYQDLGKHPVESYRDEIGVVVKSLNYTLNKLDKWAAAKKTSIPIAMFPSRAEVRHEPLGVVLIFASWNFPISLALDPVIGAIAAGNTVVLKPSEQAPACSAFLAHTIPQYMDGNAFKIIEGGAEISEKLLQQKWDKIFFTGSPQVGRIVMTEAAKQLTPVVLELGGKCPVILDSLSNPSDLKVAIKRIVSGKWGPCSGQACVGIDYMLVEEKLASTVIELLKNTLKRFYSESPKDSKCMARVVNRHHFQRLQNLLKDPLVANTIVHGGSVDEENLFIEPIILLDPPLDAAVMTEEIFGPVLPIITLNKIEESIKFINSRPKPLTIYAFTKDKKFRNRIISNTSSGSVTFNDVLIQFVCDGLPFGGVGHSGFGRYHGKYSFDTFSHEKAVMIGSYFPEFEPRYPPWNDFKMKFIRLAYDVNYIGLVLHLVLKFLGFR